MKFISYYDSPLGKITLAGDEAGLCGLWFEGEKYYAHALAMGSTDSKFCARDIATKTDAAARKGCYEKRGCALEAKSGADKKRDSADLLAKEQRAASEKFFTRDFVAQDAGEKSRATNLSVQSAGGKFCANEQSGYFEERNLVVFDQTKRWLDLYFSGREPGFTPALNPVGSAFRRAVWEILLKIPYGQTTTYGQIAREIAAARGLAKMSAQAVGGAVGHNEISIIIPCHRVVGTHGSLTGYAGGIDRKIIKLLQPGGVDMRGFFSRPQIAPRRKNAI
ncbi:methylated-DNA--[protein]-cysteine S-methyltransferase [uncultured Campylobacter sp.]|uniref:methylated-DNA--[protein]-cysteine S-methyltransferase n=1 Tax=uncultured Campylobacter sp. TaxID=218934 RepID=UPI002603C97D|nr:methylated-DNA--[protein]-cysteine S-methyltransferase [uncultured Campylobacter sp.]